MSNYSDSEFNFDDPNTSWYKTFNLIPEKSFVMDVGCSSGNFGRQLMERKNCIVDGIEIDDGDIKEAKKVLRKVYKINVETDTINLDEKYDVIFMGDVIEHLSKPIDSLEKIKSLLKPDGILVFSMPNITHMYVRLMLMKGEIQYGRRGLLDETHLHFYNRKEIYRVLNSAGYKIVEFDFTVNDMPEALLDEELDNIGLVPSKKFKKVLQNSDAFAYQYIGVAKISNTKKMQKLPGLSPENIVGGYVNEMKSQYEKIIDGLVKDRKIIIKTLNKTQVELQALKNKWYRKYPRKVASLAKRKIK